jgi:poly(3-hydroxybutyrate) depolymerase
MMADYPETFRSGAIFAGAPYKVATSGIPAMMAMLGWRIKSPEKWGSYVRSQNPGYSGKYPQIIIYQGNKDLFVNKRNGDELVKQWSNIHSTGTRPQMTIPSFNNLPDIEKNIFRDSLSKDVILYYKVNNLRHALLIDPGKCPDQGGRRGFFTMDKNYNSTLWTAIDFNLTTDRIIKGPATVIKDQEYTFSVEYTPGCVYEWSIPPDCKAVGASNQNEIRIRWGKNTGTLNVKQLQNGCSKTFHTKMVLLNP